MTKTQPVSRMFLRRWIKPDESWLDFGVDKPEVGMKLSPSTNGVNWEDPREWLSGPAEIKVPPLSPNFSPEPWVYFDVGKEDVEKFWASELALYSSVNNKISHYACTVWN